MFKYFSFFFLFFTTFLSFFFSNSNFNANYNHNFNLSLDTFYLKPVNVNYISSYFGYRTLSGKLNFHDGIDYPTVENTPVIASKSGIITNASFINGYGNTVTILHLDKTKTLYAHLSEDFLVYEGQTVNQGQIIGHVGPKYLSNGKLNGFTTGPHLHFSIFGYDGKQIDPLSVNLHEKKEVI